MIRIFHTGATTCRIVDAVDDAFQLSPDMVWLDLIAPTRDEELVLENRLGLALPTREEMAELEASSRLYRENGATFATADLIHNGDAEIPAIDPVTFVLTSGPLVTIRYFNPRPFPMIDEKIARDPGLCAGPAELFLELMEAAIDRTSEVLSVNASRVETIATHVFTRVDAPSASYEKLINKLGRAQIANARIEQSLSGLARIFAFVSLDDRIERAADPREHLKSLSRDASSLLAHAQAVAQSINFQLAAALGLINIQQSSIIKIVSVASVAFLPPTLVASIYGMNFRYMPELAQIWGYPFALVLMLLAGVGPLLWFRKKGWL